MKRCQSRVARVGTEGGAEGLYFGWQVMGVRLLVCRVLVVVLCIQHSPYSLRCVHLSTGRIWVGCPWFYDVRMSCGYLHI
jgi:hypothetical protein